MTNPNDNAFPWDDVGPHPGLTKREYFAAELTKGLLASANTWIAMWGSSEEFKNEKPDILFVKAGIQMADTLIAELNKENP